MIPAAEKSDCKRAEPATQEDNGESVEKIAGKGSEKR